MWVELAGPFGALSGGVREFWAERTGVEQRSDQGASLCMLGREKTGPDLERWKDYYTTAQEILAG